MDLTQTLLVIHIIAAGAWLGANVVQAVAPPLMARHGAEPAAAWFRVAAALGTKLYMPASILLLITGVWMVLRIEAFGFGTRFVTVGFAMIVVGIVLAVVVFKPGGEAAAQAVESGDPDRVRRATSRLATWGTVDTVLLVLTISAMVIAWS